MLKIVLHPHRTSLMAGTAEPQKLFAMLKLLPDCGSRRRSGAACFRDCD